MNIVWGLMAKGVRMVTGRAMPRWLIWSGLVLGLVLLALWGGPLAARGQGGQSCFAVYPSEQDVLVGRSGSFQVRVENIQDLHGVQLELTYDPAIIDVTALVTATHVFEGMSGDGWTTVDETTGTIAHVFTLDGSELQGFNGSGMILEVQFTALQHGMTAIEFAQAVLTDRQGLSISVGCPPSARNGSVRVLLLAPTSTATSTRTRTPTSTVTPCCPQDPSWTPTATPTASPGPPVLSVTPEVYIHPQTHNVLEGRSSAVEVRIRNAPMLYAAWVTLRYDPAVIEILDAGSPGPLEQGDLFAGKDWYAFVPPETQVIGDHITYGATLSFSEVPGPTGEALVRIHFVGRSLGVSPIVIEEVILTNQQGISLPHTSQDGLVNVISIMPTPVTATPTPATPTPSPTPTNTPTPAPVTLLYLDPEASSLALGEVRTVEVKVANVTHLHGIEFHIAYDPTIIAIVDENPGLPGIQIGYGNFLSPVSVAQNVVDSVGGVIHMAYTQGASDPPQSGAGVVARFRVRGMGGGATSLAMHDTQLLDGALNTMAHSAVGGFAAVDSRVVSGFAFLEGRSQHGGIQITNGATLLATTKNDGSFVFISPVPVGSTIDLTARHPGYLHANKSLLMTAETMVSAGSTTLLGGDVAGPRTTLARAAECAGDLTVDAPGVADGRINVIDLAFVAGRFGAAEGDLTWQPSPDGCHPEWFAHRADINGDRVVNILDLVRVSANYGLSGPTDW